MLNVHTVLKPWKYTVKKRECTFHFYLIVYTLRECLKKNMVINYWLIAIKLNRLCTQFQFRYVQRNPIIIYIYNISCSLSVKFVNQVYIPALNQMGNIRRAIFSTNVLLKKRKLPYCCLKCRFDRIYKYLRFFLSWWKEIGNFLLTDFINLTYPIR